MENRCDVEKIQKIADIYGLKVIYDAAHAFGVNYKGVSLLKHGDLSVLSFHATKVFNTLKVVPSFVLTLKRRSVLMILKISVSTMRLQSLLLESMPR